MGRIARNRAYAHRHDLTVALETLLQRDEIRVTGIETQLVPVGSLTDPDRLRVDRQNHEAIAALTLELLDASGKAGGHPLTDLADEGIHHPRARGLAAVIALLQLTAHALGDLIALHDEALRLRDF